MASETSNRYRERARTHTHDRVIIQDYGQFVNPTTTSLVLPRPKNEEETKADRLQATWGLFQAVNWAMFSGNLLVDTPTVDFSSMPGLFLARGGFFQTRRFPARRVAKYPLVPDATGVLPKSTYESLLTELRVLSHPPLREHGGIVRLTSVEWARIDPIGHSWVPVLFLEEAQHGSLQQYVASETPDIKTCLQLSQEIGSGLQALHASGVIHGDLKSQNVLVFDLGDGRVRAKLSDFGSSVIKDESHQTVTLTTGTPPWTSPEHSQPVHTSLLCGADTYSYGLLVWRLFLQGENHPFDGQDSEDIQRRKKDDLILGEAAQSIEEAYKKAMLLGGRAGSCTRFQSYRLAVSIPRRCLRHCLSASIETRDLDKAVESLHYGSYLSRPLEDPPTPMKDSGGNRDGLYARSRVSTWFFSAESDIKRASLTYVRFQTLVCHIRLFGVPKGVKDMLYQCASDIAENPGAVDWFTEIESCFQLSLQTFDGFGPPEDDRMAVGASLMRKAAVAGYTAAGVMLGQFYEASGVVMDAATRSQYEKDLVRGVEEGSLLARIWLRRYNPQALRNAKQREAQKVAGVSFGEKNKSKFHLGDIINAELGEDAFTRSSRQLAGQLPLAAQDLQGIWLSERRNSHLHTGAAFGVSRDQFRPWLGLLRTAIDARDKDGNTALLLAVRFGHVDIAKLLLEAGAQASLPNKRGETPWHWLVAIENPEDMFDLVKLLLNQSGTSKNFLDATAEPPFGFIDALGINLGGTALHWAVELGMTALARELVSSGADVCHAFKGIRPVDMAIQRNKPEILRVFLEELRQKGETLGQPLPSGPDQVPPDHLSDQRLKHHVFQAVASHPFHERLAYGGKGWIDDMRQTLLVLRDFDLAVKLPISVLSEFFQATGCSTAILMLLSEDGFLEGTSDPARFWANVAQEIMPWADTTNVLYAMKRAKEFSADGRLPNAENLLKLCTASLGCDGSVVDAIAGEGVKVDFQTQQARTPLMGAVWYRNFEIASVLASHGADVNALWKPIHPNSSKEEHPDVNMLYEHLTGNLDMAIAPLRYLLEPLHSKKDSVPSFIVVPSWKTTALHLACLQGNPLIVDYLLQKFNTPYHLDFVNHMGYTALHQAAFNGHVDVARMLCRAGARVDILAGDESLDPKDRPNALDYCHRLLVLDSQDTGRDIEDVYLGRLEVAKILVLERQAVRTVASRHDDGAVWSVGLCFYAARKNMARLLKGALENLRNDAASGISWQDALDRLLVDAALGGHAGTNKLLVDYGANVNQVLPVNRQATLLHQAVIEADAEIVYLLLRAGAAVNAFDMAGRTPLMNGTRM
ncbi:TKL protein kinase [Magnaporthiopsis poae ATCC 64411]|uniref:TKL protein kinase n=1 Tax=Magnaporthiopsis poae (strain ATCC 64411 / 73-15) TaxID=644358 RepID=A0A0C4EC51_MAGP6|nr:TKL protein kinase [Magnaporthiopsis poae ATCC 64411]